MMGFEKTNTDASNATRFSISKLLVDHYCLFNYGGSRRFNRNRVVYKERSTSA